ncbi:hypothetical protein T265_08104 [Opisthorchis viverrini]|nr:hypothetical protein T265_08104 [Opisthorchis viverrini]KER24166.1 hypothetical protein T265_08104 [Opisthorchis viverrini]
MRRHIRVSKPKRKYFSSRKPQRSAPKRSSHASRKTRTHKTATLLRHTPACTNPSPAGLISVHRLIDSTALAGQELLANNGHVAKSVVAHVSSAVQANDQHTPNVRRRSSEQPARSILLSMNGNINPTDHHPFLHSWEYSDDYVTSRSWRSRRNAYLALRLIHSDAVDSYDNQENLSDDCALSSFSFKTGDTTSKLTTRTTKTAHKRPWVRKSEFVPSPTSYGDDTDYAISLELEAQRKLLSSLEPCVLGYRWPTLVIEEGRVNVASKLSPMVDRETMVLWHPPTVISHIVMRSWRCFRISMPGLIFLLLTLLSVILVVLADHHPSVSSEQPAFIFDVETGQWFPISEASLREDPPLLLPPPDPTEFPPAYLESLLRHCDDPTPSFLEFLNKSWIGLSEFGLNWKRYPVHSGVLFRVLGAVRITQLIHICIIAVVLSLIRFALQKYLLDHLTVRLGIPVKTTQRLLESSWKAFWFLVLWLCTFHTLILSGRTDFQYPLRIFKGVRFEVGYFDVPTPPDYYRVYLLQLGFYLHSLWSVLFIDVWRKDSAVLIIHHFMTLLLLQFSLVLRLHRIGALVVFLHDLNDVFLEIAKVNVYLQTRHGKKRPINVILANLFFALFTISWVIMRLYWFPLKVLYATSWGLYITNLGRECRSFLFFNSMLWALFAMHLYWFRFIAIMAVRLILRPSSGDMREDESEDDETASDSGKQQTILADGKHKPGVPSLSQKQHNNSLDASNGSLNSCNGYVKPLKSD